MKGIIFFIAVSVNIFLCCYAHEKEKNNETESYTDSKTSNSMHVPDSTIKIGYR